MKIAISGKGGVGKTTVAAGLARYYAGQGRRVMAIDADADSNLASALGLGLAEVKGIVPIAHMEELIAERTGAQPGTMGGFFTLNPEVSDIPGRFSRDVNGVRLLVMGSVEQGGSGCLCPEGTMLKNLMRHLLVQDDEFLVIDMEAGIEHLGRGTAEHVDAMLVVVEPGQRSIQTAKTVRGLAADIGIAPIYAVLNRVADDDEDAWLLEQLRDDLLVVGSVRESEAVRTADRRGVSPFDGDGSFVEDIAGLAAKLEKTLAVV